MKYFYIIFPNLILHKMVKDISAELTKKCNKIISNNPGNSVIDNKTYGKLIKYYNRIKEWNG